MVVGEIPEPADLLVVGAGPAGYAGALRAAELGRRVVLVERGGSEGLGGDCLNGTCVPARALGDVADLAHRVGRWGAAGITGTVGVDLGAWHGWRDRLVGGLRADIDRRLRAAGVSVVSGELRFTRRDQAVVAGLSGTARYFQFTDVLIATGSRTAAPDGLAPDGVRIVDAAGLLAAQAIPARLVVIGAGPTGVELATSFAKLGAEVTVVERAKRPLPGIDERLVREIVRRWRETGVRLVTGATAIGDDGGAVLVDTADGPRPIAADTVLVATGRTPNTDSLGLDRLGIAPERDGTIPVGDDRRSRGHVAAAGDVTPGLALAHTASAEARVAVAALCGRRVAYQPQAVPVTVFSDPCLAAVGWTAAQAREQGADAVEVDLPLGGSPRARMLSPDLDPDLDLDPNAAPGVVRVVVEAGSGTVLGVHLAGPQAAEIIGVAATVIEFGGSADDLARILVPYPTVAGSLVESARHALRVTPAGSAGALTPAVRAAAGTAMPPTGAHPR